ncbi:MAG TPA: hypothetical protein VKQ52_04700 [Puia sp.]|nr:hypothetical protein [Puia sp.]
MKTFFFFTTALLIAVMASAQFQSTDELRQYNNNYIRPNGHQSITAQQLNNLHAGMLDFIDTALLNRAKSIRISKDTIYLQLGTGSEIPIKLPPQVNADWNAVSGPAQIVNKPVIPPFQVNADWNATGGVAQILNKPTIPAAQVNADWNAISGPAQILNKPGTPMLSDVLTAGNLAIPGTTTQAPIVMQLGDLLTTPQAGAVEYDGLALYITDGQSVRHNLTQTDRVFKVYSWDYNNDTLFFSLTGWDVQYVGDPTYAPTVASTIDVEITVTGGTPAGSVITMQFEGQTVYTLTVTETAGTDYYVIGTVKVNQDIKYPEVFYIKGAVETINGAGSIQSANTAYRYTSDGFTNPVLTFGSSASTLIRIGCTYTVDKKQQGRWIYSPLPGNPFTPPPPPSGGGNF